MKFNMQVCFFALLTTFWGFSNAVKAHNTAHNEHVQPTSIWLNQVGYHPSAKKLATIESDSPVRFEVIDAKTNEVVFSGASSQAKIWPEAGKRVVHADFSKLREIGHFVVRTLPPHKMNSAEFQIDEHIYGELNRATAKAYYFNRSGIELDSKYAQQWARPAGHKDTQVTIHASAASEARPTGTKIAAAKGWYDAGDYGKYVVNSGISTYTLLHALSRNYDYYQTLDLRIPESSNASADLFDEISWNLDWLLTMQDQDGGVYHKLTSAYFAPDVMPHEATTERFIIGKGTAASLNYAAVLAKAARVIKQFDLTKYQTEQLINRAERAFAWALANPKQFYVQPSDIHTGPYSDTELDDEFLWAAAELWLATKKPEYLRHITASTQRLDTASWNNVRALAWLSLAYDGQGDLAQQYQAKLIQSAEAIASMYQLSAFKVPMRKQDYYWGSNSVAAYRAMLLLDAWHFQAKRDYLDAAQAVMDYLLGRNPTSYSFVTGFGSKTARHIHHRPSEADKVIQPVPGFVVGGPHSGQQDKCDYPSALPALSYLDQMCSYSTNEVAINWNAPVVYISYALINAYSQQNNKGEQ